MLTRFAFWWVEHISPWIARIPIREGSDSILWVFGIYLVVSILDYDHWPMTATTIDRLELLALGMLLVKASKQ